jgi:hypothetical protein
MATLASIPKMGKCNPIIRFLNCCGISHLYSQPNRLMAKVIKKVSHGSHQSPQSHFAVPTMEGMALGPSPVRTIASLAAHRADAEKYTGPSTAEGKPARSSQGTKVQCLQIRWRIGVCVSKARKGRSRFAGWPGATALGDTLLLRSSARGDIWIPGIHAAPSGARLYRPRSYPRLSPWARLCRPLRA